MNCCRLSQAHHVPLPSGSFANFVKVTNTSYDKLNRKLNRNLDLTGQYYYQSLSTIIKCRTNVVALNICDSILKFEVFFSHIFKLSVNELLQKVQPQLKLRMTPFKLADFRSISLINIVDGKYYFFVDNVVWQLFANSAQFGF